MKEKAPWELNENLFKTCTMATKKTVDPLRCPFEKEGEKTYAATKWWLARYKTLQNIDEFLLIK